MALTPITTDLFELVDEIRAWDAARVVVGHGDVFEGDVAAALDGAGLARITG